MRNTRLSTRTVNAQAKVVAEDLSGGFLDFMTGARPESADDPVSDEMRLSRNSFGVVAFAAPRDGVLRANPMGKAVATRTGEPTWCRCSTKDGQPVVDGSVGKPGDVNEDGEPFNATGNVDTIVKGQIITIKDFTYVVNKKTDCVFITG